VPVAARSPVSPFPVATDPAHPGLAFQGRRVPPRSRGVGLVIPFGLVERRLRFRNRLLPPSRRPDGKGSCWSTRFQRAFIGGAAIARSKKPNDVTKVLSFLGMQRASSDALSCGGTCHAFPSVAIGFESRLIEETTPDLHVSSSCRFALFGPRPHPAQSFLGVEETWARPLDRRVCHPDLGCPLSHFPLARCISFPRDVNARAVALLSFGCCRPS